MRAAADLVQYRPGEWVPIDACRLGSRAGTSIGSVERRYQRLIQLGDGQAWPPVVCHWDADRFVVDDGRHELLACLCLGREKILVCWLVEDNSATMPA